MMIETFTYMLENLAFETVEDWWNFFYDRDKTILMTGTENMTATWVNTTMFQKVCPASGCLCHGKEEIKFLTSLG